MQSSSHSSDATASNLQVVPTTAVPQSSPDSTELARTSNVAVRSSDSYSSFPPSEPYYSAPPISSGDIAPASVAFPSPSVFTAGSHPSSSSTVVPHSNQSTASISESHLVSHSD